MNHPISSIINRFNRFNKNDVWTTFQGNKEKICNLSNQHLSNIIHFFTFINTEYPRDLKDLIKEVRKEKYGGKTMPWRPKISFKPEINLIKKRGWAKSKGDGNYDIIINNVWHGEILINSVFI